MTVYSENFRLRQECLNSCDLDIIGIAETLLYIIRTLSSMDICGLAKIEAKNHIKAKKKKKKKKKKIRRHRIPV